MCGRFYLPQLQPDPLDIFEQHFGLTLPRFYPPPLLGDRLPFGEITVIFHDGEKYVLQPMFWNLIPASSKKFQPPKPGWFNARKDRLGNPYQKNLLRFRRCIVPAGSFRENKKVQGKDVFHSATVNDKRVRRKESYEFRVGAQELFALGGIYDVWRGENQTRYSTSIITLEPVKIIAEVHDRMPFIVPRSQIAPWLNPDFNDYDALVNMITQFPNERLTRKRVWPPEQPSLFQ